MDTTLMGFWRFLSYVRGSPLLRLVLVVIVIALATLPFEIVLSFIPGKNALPADVLALLTVFSIVLVFLYRGLVSVLEDRDVTELSFKRFLPPLLSGTAWGSGLFLCIIGILTCLDMAHFNGLNGPAGVIKTLILNAHGAIFEEILFRGVLYRCLEERFGSIVSLILSATFFGLAHIGNPGAGLGSTASIALTSGLLLPLAFSASRTIWMPIGLHFAWNFTESGIFGLAVSGFDLHGLIRIVLIGPSVLTGGSFGPEASIVTISVCLIASAWFAYLAYRRGNWIPFRLKRVPANESLARCIPEVIAEPSFPRPEKPGMFE